MALPVFNFLYIQAGTGKTGTSGDQLEASWTNNFDLIKSLLTSLDTDVQRRVLSNDIKQLKVIDGIAYFTTDNSTWVSLGPSFANITGNPDDCEALLNKFNNYTTIVQFNNLKSRVSEVENDIVVLENTQTVQGLDIDNIKNTLNDGVTGVLVRLSKVEVDMRQKITSQSIIEIREKAPGLLEYTTDGSDWSPVSSALGVQWGEILGNIENQSDLMNRFDILQDAIDAANETINTLDTKVQNHIENFDNPHLVTKEQVGLGNVDDTSDDEKPLSQPQREAVEEMLSQSSSVSILTKQGYEELETKNENTLYIITDVDN